MKASAFVKISILGVFVVGLGARLLADPVVSNVRAEQRPGTGLVDIYYDLTGTIERAEVTVEGSDDDGASYTLAVTALTGDVGSSVSLGTDRHIVWDALADSPQVQSTSMRIKLTAVEWVEPVPMVEIPAGSFAMGDGFSEGGSDERPVHTVTLSRYRIGATEVTLGQWQEVRDWALSNGYTDLVGVGAGKGLDHPVHSVNWYDVVKWCNAASEKVGLEPVYLLSEGGAVFRTGEVSPYMDYSKSGYRLPTEAEWERAARGGLEGKRFPWGDEISHMEANYSARPSTYSYDVNGSEGSHPDYDEGALPYTSPVGRFAANGLGLVDVAGNVWEWCGDWYGSSYYGSSPGSDPAGPGSGSRRVIRGGDWIVFADGCRVAVRFYFGPSYRGHDIGFRVSRRG
jgi:formylglycine-generating enzyme required for sulfatase activity